MNPMEPDWEGFQSFNEQPKLPLSPPPKHPPTHQRSPQRAEDNTGALQKKLTFRSKNKRKGSFVASLPSQPSRKNTSHLQLTTAIPPKTSLIDRLKRTSFLFERKEDGIPIFHEAEQRQPQGQTIYRRQRLSTAEEELARKGRQEGAGLGEELRFESRFESGNLEQAVRVGSEYHLYMAADTNTRGHRQWFYFSVTAPHSRTATFVVHSFRKRLSLFQAGMRPYGKRRDQGDEAWRAVGRNVKYCRQERGRGEQRVEFSLSFQVQLRKEEEFCIASSVPYTFSYLKHRLALLSTPLVTQQVLCKTLTGLEVPLITVNEHATARPHRYIIINARTHPGESSASWVADGLLAHLAASALLHQLLAEFAVVLKVVPMLNVEGVCLGNYRTGTMGMDFNRLFLSGSPDLFPEIAALKRLVEECKARGRVDLFLDLHGHSILPGCFMYGPDPVFAPKTALGRLVGEMGKSRYFMKVHCVQGVDSSKAETSRIYFQAQEGVFSLTCQNSLGLYCRNGHRGSEVQCEAADWQQFGKELITIMLNIYDEYGDEKEHSSSRIQHIGETLSLLRSTEEEQFVWQKSKTDNGKMTHQLQLLNQLYLEQIDLPPQLTLSQDRPPQQSLSLNDSDASSEDLSLHQQQELIKIVRRNIAKHSPTEARERERERGRWGSKGMFINNFKEYRFGVEDSTISEWYTRKRLFSVPKHLKHERQGQSYLIRKKLPLPPNSELAAQSADIGKRTRTENSSSNKELASRQKQLLQNLLLRK